MRALLILAAFLLQEPVWGNGHLDELVVEHGTYLIDWRDAFSAGERERLRTWLEHMDGVVASLHGSWPSDRIRIAFRRYDRNTPWATGALPFARILRNAPEGILFYINPAATVEELVNDWTAYHEFAHLFITYPGRAGAWFSEGMASYYQNILQLRAGIIDASEARRRYTAAFGRGEADNADKDLTLGQLSTRMMERRAFMRVYWSGALYFLEADLALRALPEPTTLDAVIREYDKCCLRNGDERPALEIAEDFDRIAGTEIFVPAFKRYAEGREIPPYKELLDAGAFARLLNESERPGG